MRRLPLFLPIALTALAAPQVPPRDWKEAPAVVQLDTQADIYAMGDVHGDYQRMVELLAGAGVIAGIPAAPDRPVWTAARAVLVFTGDMIDKGPNALGVLTFQRALQPGASAAGGRVVVLMGNHEAEFLAHPGGAKGEEFAGQLKQSGLDAREVASCGGDLGRFLCSLPFAARVNDWFFSHAGNTDGRTLAHLAADLQSDVDRHGFAAPQLIGDNSLLEARIGEKGPNGRAWFEAGGSRVPADRLLAGYATALGVRHIVEGHHHAATRFPDGAVRRLGELFNWRGELFLIDTGMSRDIGDSAGALLHIRTAKQNAAAVCADGRETAIWDSRQPKGTAKASPCQP
jgi:Calcineurin-like phosphoesterase